MNTEKPGKRARAEIYLNCFKKAQTIEDFLLLMDAIETAASALAKQQKTDSSTHQTIKLIGRWEE